MFQVRGLIVSCILWESVNPDYMAVLERIAAMARMICGNLLSSSRADELGFSLFLELGSMVMVPPLHMFLTFHHRVSF